MSFPTERLGIEPIPSTGVGARAGGGAVDAAELWKRFCEIQGDIGRLTRAQEGAVQSLQGMVTILGRILEAVQKSTEATEAGRRRVEAGLDELLRNRKAMGTAIGAFTRAVEPLQGFLTTIPELLPALRDVAAAARERVEADRELAEAVRTRP